MEPENNKSLIMVVDDEESIRTLVSSTLEMNGFKVVTASDGNSALALLQECTPELIVMDIRMPGLDGFQTMSHIRHIRDLASVPIIMLTARRDDLSFRDAMEFGATDYMTKPFSTDVLVARVKAKIRWAKG